MAADPMPTAAPIRLARPTLLPSSSFWPSIATDSGGVVSAVGRDERDREAYCQVVRQAYES